MEYDEALLPFLVVIYEWRPPAMVRKREREGKKKGQGNFPGSTSVSRKRFENHLPNYYLFFFFRIPSFFASCLIGVRAA